MRTEQPIKRHGGKSYLAKWIVGLMPPRCEKPNAPACDGWLHYVEPYFGGGSVLFANDPTGISEVVNDLDGELSNFWSVLQSDAALKKFHRIIHFTPFSEDEFRRAKQPLRLEDRDARAAARFFVRNRQSRQGLERDFATMTKNRTRRGMNEQVSSWLSALDGLDWFHERLRRVVILNRDALAVIKQQDGPRTLFYLDPPYLHETRNSVGEYHHEMTVQQHGQLLADLASIRGRFMLSGYHSVLYDSWAKGHGFKCHERLIDNKASSKVEKEMKIECVWTNY